MILDELQREFEAVRARARVVRGIFDAAAGERELAEIEKRIADPAFWTDPANNQRVLRERKRVARVVETDKEIAAAVGDLEAFLELAGEGEPVEDECAADLKALATRLDEIETESLLSGEHDGSNAIVTLNAGAGGTEAQDWAQMLQRMYLRWAERKGFGCEITDEQAGEEAGIKSASLVIKGENAYGLIRSEVGVHRLVRISPFDSNARRHTSFASVSAYPEIDDTIEIDIRPDELRIDTYRASGAGGQHVNMTDSAVRITHLPTNIVVQCQNERSQHKNKATAMKQLRSRLYDLELRKKRSEAQKIEAAKLDIDFGSQIRNYVLAPYRLVKDLRSQVEMGDVDRVLDGDLDRFMHAYLVYSKTGRSANDETAVPA
ncbi:MAG: peptide chain release factor 2 [Acidobacteriia bacterium]|nr:peptide chain release factor 2 [Terriglobia bacterium]MYC67048.1 peptide chain release factor 2 [Terriglobia bacterium]